MKRLIGLMAVILVMAGLASCTGPASGRAPTSRATAMTAPSADHLVTVEAPSWARETITTSAAIIATAGNTSMPWRFVSMSGDGRSVQLVWVAGGGCTTFDGLVVEETSSAVTITVSGTTDWHAQVCAANLITGAGTVTLTAPLGTRTVWHAPVHEDWVAPAGVLGGA